MTLNSSSCPSLAAASYWPRWLPSTARSRPRPFVVLFDGSAGSSWFADALDRHASVFIAGYESLEWVGHDAYVGWNATAWQPAWLQTVWADTERVDGVPWERWLTRYYANEKLDPLKHRAPLTVRAPKPLEVSSANAIGFKLRPYTVETNHLATTLKEALRSLDGVVLVINRLDKLAQAASLYRRRFDGKPSQFANAAQSEVATNHQRAKATARRAAEFGGSGGSATTGGTSSGASFIPARELEKMLEHREAQEVAIDCLVDYLGRPTLRVQYEHLRADFVGTMRGALRHLGVADGLDDAAITALNDPASDARIPPSSIITAAAASLVAPAANTSTTTALPGFVKRSPATLCHSIANLAELCAALRGSRVYARHIAPLEAIGGCSCAPSEELLGSGGVDPGAAVAPASTPASTPALHASAYEQFGTHTLAAATPLEEDALARELRTPTRGVPPMLVVVGTHHKTGTVLMGQVLRVSTAVLSDHLTTSEPWVREPRVELGGVSWQAYLRGLSVERGVAAECTRALAELRDMAELYDRAKALPSPPARVTVLRLEEVAANYSSAMSGLVRALLRPLRIPTHRHSPGGGAAVAHVVAARVENAIAKFDLSRHAPMPDKASHVSAKDEKQSLREALLRDNRLRPLLRGLRQALDYEPTPPFAKADLQRISQAIDAATAALWKAGQRKSVDSVQTQGV